MPSKTDVQGTRKMWNENINPSRKEGSNVAMRLKFYESKGEKKTTLKKAQSTNNYFATTSRMQKEIFPFENTKAEPVYATVNKKNKTPKQTAVIAPRQAISNEVTNGLNLPHTNGHTQRGSSYHKEDSAKVRSQSQHEQKPNGTYFVMAKEPNTKQPEEPQYETIPYTSGKTDKPRFLSTSEIGKIYQKTTTKIPENHTKKINNVTAPKTIRKGSKREAKSIIENAENPTEYQQKIQQSKNALNELRKSLSNDDYLNGDFNQETSNKKNSTKNKSKAIDKRLRKTKTPFVTNDHEEASKQNSNNSTVSNSSTMSKKLLTLKENKKQTPQRSEKSFAKKFSWRINSNLDETEFVSDCEKKSPEISKKDKETQHKRHTISTMEYTLADISPASTRSNRSQPREKKLAKTKSADFHITRPTNLEIPSSSQINKTSKQKTPQKSPNSDRTSTPSSLSSLMQGESKLVFKVDLDEPYSKDKEKKEKQDDLVLYREHGIYIPVKARNAKLTARRNKDLNKWIQTDGPPIRPPKSRTYSTQTGINPCTCVSKRLQARPCYIPDFLASKITQTVSKTTTETGTQTHQKRVKTQSSQTRTRRYRSMNSQTPAPPIMQESSVQAVTPSENMHAQTEDEDSEIWGNNVSLDRLIRSGAMKRSRSFGHGIRADTEKMRDRSASIDAVTDKKTAASTSTAETKQIPQKDLEITGKITTYSWNEKGKFVKIFVSYSGVHLIPSKNINVKTNGINLHLTIVEETSIEDTEAEDPTQQSLENRKFLTSSLHLQRLRRPIAGLTYNVQRDMITIMLRKQKQTLWTSLTFQNKFVI